MSTFSHIKSVKDLEQEILKTEIKKEIIKKDLRDRVETARRMLTPAVIGLQITRAIIDKKKSTSSKIIDIVSRLLGGMEASKYGAQILKKVLQ